MAEKMNLSDWQWAHIWQEIKYLSGHWMNETNWSNKKQAEPETQIPISLCEKEIKHFEGGWHSRIFSNVLVQIFITIIQFIYHFINRAIGSFKLSHLEGKKNWQWQKIQFWNVSFFFVSFATKRFSCLIFLVSCLSFFSQATTESDKSMIYLTVAVAQVIHQFGIWEAIIIIFLQFRDLNFPFMYTWSMKTFTSALFKWINIVTAQSGKKQTSKIIN